MSKDFSINSVGKTDYQPLTPAGKNVESAANGTPSTDGMTPPTLTDSHINDQSWSATHKERNAQGELEDVTYNYVRTDASMQSVMPWSVRTDASGNSVNPYDQQNGLMDQVGEERGTVQRDDPEQQLYKKDKYVAGKSVQLKTDADHPAFSSLAQVDPKGTQIDQLSGTLQNPNVTNELESTLFINGTTSQEDVHQCNIGDCYFLAAVLQVIHYDPAKIVNMMKLVGDEVSTTFYYKDGDKWNPTVIKTKFGLVGRDHYYSNAPDVAQYMGANVRINYDPARCVWSSSIDGNILKIDKTRFFEAALWVNCLEQAFSLFAQKYGQYGHKMQNDLALEKSGDLERFQGIEGGFACYTLNMFYGDDATVTSGAYGATETVAPKNEQNDAFNNYFMISELLKLAKAQKGDADEDVHICAASSTESAVSRAQLYIGMLKTELTEAINNQALTSTTSDPALLNQALAQLNEAETSLSTYFEKPTPQGREGTSSEDQLVIRHTLDRVLYNLENNDAFISQSLPSFAKFRTTVATVVSFTAGDGGVAGADIFIYSGHAYNVDSVNFLDKDGKSLNDGDLDNIIDQIDLKRSKVLLQNPHGQTKATIHEEESRKAQGDFSVSLEHFLANVEYVTVATVKNDRKKDDK